MGWMSMDSYPEHGVDLNGIFLFAGLHLKCLVWMAVSFHCLNQRRER